MNQLIVVCRRRIGAAVVLAGAEEYPDISGRRRRVEQIVGDFVVVGGRVARRIAAERVRRDGHGVLGALDGIVDDPIVVGRRLDPAPRLYGYSGLTALHGIVLDADVAGLENQNSRGRPVGAEAPCLFAVRDREESGCRTECVSVLPPDRRS